jgi:hypothetical protein
MLKEAILLESTVHGQILTSRYKCITYIVREGEFAGKVIKGPYTSYSTYHNLKTFTNILKQVHVRIPTMTFIDDYVTMPVFSSVPICEWRTEQKMDKIIGKPVQVICRESLGSQQLNRLALDIQVEILLGETWLYRDYAFMKIFGRGDQGFWNCLVKKSNENNSDWDCLLIDYEETTKPKEMTCIEEITTKKLSKAVCEKIKKYIELNYYVVMKRFECLVNELKQMETVCIEIGTREYWEKTVGFLEKYITEKSVVEKEKTNRIESKLSPCVYKGSIFNVKCRGNIPLDIAKSALQKGIRRNDPVLAISFFIRIFEIGEKNKSVMTNLKNRLVIISCEDIGPANLSFIDRVVSLEFIQENIDKLIQLVYDMCMEKKTRIPSWMRARYTRGLKDEEKKYIDNLSSIPLLERWKRVHRESKDPFLSTHFITEILESKEKVYGDLRLLGGRKSIKTLIGDVIWSELYNEWYCNNNNNSQRNFVNNMIQCLFRLFKTKPEPRLYIHLVYFIVYDMKNCEYSYHTWEIPNKQEFFEYAYDRVISIPDYVIDKHTSLGRKRGKNTGDFYENGCKIINEYMPIQEKYSSWTECYFK